MASVASCLVNALTACRLLSWSCYVVRPRAEREVFLAGWLGIAAIALVLG